LTYQFPVFSAEMQNYKTYIRNQTGNLKNYHNSVFFYNYYVFCWNETNWSVKNPMKIQTINHGQKTI